MSSAIEWTNDTWNPVAGCTMVSAGKEPGRKAAYLNVINESGRWTGRVQTIPEALEIPLHWKKPRRIFVNSMSDLFHEDVPFDFVDSVFAVMALCPQHTFQILTKRPERMAEYLSFVDGSGWDTMHRVGNLMGELQVGQRCFLPHDEAKQMQAWPLPNCWLGTSVENQAAADERIPHLLGCPAAVRFLSCEPLLGAIDLHSAFYHPRLSTADSYKKLMRSRVDWVIAGGESGPARTCNIEWIRSIVRQCKAAAVACFVKQLGANITAPYVDATGAVFRPQLQPEYLPMKLNDRKGGDPEEWPADLRMREFPNRKASDENA